MVLLFSQYHGGGAPTASTSSTNFPGPVLPSNFIGPRLPTTVTPTNSNTTPASAGSGEDSTAAALMNTVREAVSEAVTEAVTEAFTEAVAKVTTEAMADETADSTATSPDKIAESSSGHEVVAKETSKENVEVCVMYACVWLSMLK